MKHLFLSHLKHDFMGYISLLLLCYLILGTDLISLFIFLLFIYLLTDVIAHDSRRFLKFIPSNVLFWIFYIVLITLFIVFSFRIAPLLFTDMPHYFELIWKDVATFIQTLSQKYQIPINLNGIQAGIFSESTQSFGHVIRIFNNVTKNVVYFIFALVLNFLLFHEKERIKEVFTSNQDGILAYLYQFVLLRIQRFYLYFRKVMGGQVIISLINLSITAVVIYFLHLPHKITLLCLIFFFGLLPVIGNIISNSILTITALVSSGVFPALVCLGLLVGIHKLEYFLNSKIVGSIINLPMFITLSALLIGEVLLGVWGIILAIPFVLTIKDELDGTIGP